MKALNSTPVIAAGSLRALLLLGALGAVAVAAVPENGATDRESAATFYSSPAQLGNGTVKTYVTRSTSGAIVSLGVEISESALEGLGSEPQMLHLPFPKESASSQYTFMMIGWNPRGHEPENIYTLPHFDFHFAITPEEEMAKIAGGPDPIVPEAKFIPTDYISPGNVAIPGMGVHWVDRTAGELNGKTFDQTFLWGYTGGKLIFVEPMITKAFLETRPNFSVQLKQPQAFQRRGLYPQRYSIRYDAEDRVYRVSIDELASR